MNLRNEILGIIGEFSGQNNHLNIPVAFIKMTGDINQAILLNQIIYWSDRSTRKDGYFYKSYPEWAEEIFLTKYQVTTAANKLKEKGLISTKLMKANGAPTLHYKVRSKSLYDWIVKYLTMDSKNTNNGKLSNLTIDSEETEQSIVKKLDDGKSRNLTMDSEETCLSTITEITTKTTTENTTKTTPKNSEQENIGGVDESHDSDFEEIADQWQKLGFGLLTQRSTEQILDWLKLHDKELIIHVLQYAHDNGAINMAYVLAVLKNARAKNVKTVDDFKAEQSKRAAQRSSTRFNSSQKVVEPEWFSKKEEPLHANRDLVEKETNSETDNDIAERIKAFRDRKLIGK